jgi:hypothetical protein
VPRTRQDPDRHDERPGAGRHPAERLVWKIEDQTDRDRRHHRGDPGDQKSPEIAVHGLIVNTG